MSGCRQILSLSRASYAEKLVIAALASTTRRRQVANCCIMRASARLPIGISQYQAKTKSRWKRRDSASGPVL